MSDIYHVWGEEDGCAILRDYDQFNKCHKYQVLAIFTLEQFIIGESLYKIRMFYFLCSLEKITQWFFHWFITMVIFNIAKISFSFYDVDAPLSWEDLKWWFTRETYETISRSKNTVERNPEIKNTKTHSLILLFSSYYGCKFL